MDKQAMDMAVARRAMVLSQLRPEGVTDPLVLAAMGNVPRESFVPEHLRSVAYMDRPLMLDGRRPMMAPAELGRLLNFLEPRPGEKALVVGGGGYAAAVLGAIGLDVVQSADIPKSGSDRFDLILVEGALPSVPAALSDRLNRGGRIGLAIADRSVTRLSIGRRETSALGITHIGETQLPLLPGHEPAAAFQF